MQALHLSALLCSSSFGAARSPRNPPCLRPRHCHSTPHTHIHTCTHTRSRCAPLAANTAAVCTHPPDPSTKPVSSSSSSSRLVVSAPPPRHPPAPPRPSQPAMRGESAGGIGPCLRAAPAARRARLLVVAQGFGSTNLRRRRVVRNAGAAIAPRAGAQGWRLCFLPRPPCCAHIAARARTRFASTSRRSPTRNFSHPECSPPSPARTARAALPNAPAQTRPLPGAQACRSPAQTALRCAPPPWATTAAAA